MKYVCLCYEEGSPARADVLAAYDEELRASGTLIAAEAVEPAAATTTVRVRNGRLVVSEESIDAADRLGRFVLIDARDLNDAIRIASRLPAAASGSVEIRRVH